MMCTSISRASAPLLLRVLRDGDLLGISRVQHDCDQSRPTLGGWIRRHPVKTPRWLVKRLARFEHFGRLIIDPQLVLAFQDVHEPWSWVAMGQSGFSWLDGHFNERRLCVLTV